MLARPKPDFETVNAVYHPDHVFVSLGASSLGEGEALGAKGFRDWLDQTNDAVRWEADLTGVVDVGHDKVLAVSLNRFWGATSGIATEDRVWSVVTVRDGQLIRSEAYLDPLRALKAAMRSE